jgi:hypothetical protein
VKNGVTWYGILGVLPGASPDQIQQHYEAKAAVVRPELVAGSPSKVVAAVTQAQALLDDARRVLSDREARQRYDEEIGVRRSGGGLARTGTLATEAAWAPPDFDVAGFEQTGTVLGVLSEVTDLFGPKTPSRPGRIVMPDVRWLFYSVCREAVATFDLRLTVVRLTEHPMAVDGLVVDQSPGPLVKARPAGGLTIYVWHPPSPVTGR